MILNLFYITSIVCFIVDISGIVETAKRSIFRYVKGKKAEYVEFSLKPIDCSLCMTWWVGLSYLVISSNFSLYGVFMVSVFSLLSDIVTHFFNSIKDFIGNLINRIK